MAEDSRFLMSIVWVVVGILVDSDGFDGLGVLPEGEEKCRVMSAGPEASSVRFTVMGTAGLWYFKRIRWLRQNCLD